MERETTVLPSQDSDLLDATEAILLSDGPVQLSIPGSTVPLPQEVRTVLADVVRSMRRGQAVTLAPLSQQLTTQQAADLLGISRPTLIALLDAGRIPFERPSRHRRLRLRDVLSYQSSRRSEQREALDALTREAEDIGLYAAAPEGFEPALDDVRRTLA